MPGKDTAAEEDLSQAEKKTCGGGISLFSFVQWLALSFLFMLTTPLASSMCNDDLLLCVCDFLKWRAGVARQRQALSLSHSPTHDRLCGLGSEKQ